MKIRRFDLCGACRIARPVSCRFCGGHSPKTDRIVTTQNGTGYSVSSVGRHIIPVSDSSQSFDFLAAGRLRSVHAYHLGR